MFVTIQCIWCVHFLIFEGVLRMKLQRYSVKMFGEIPLPQVRRFSLKVFLLVMVSCSRISLMENDHVDVDIGQKIDPSRCLRFFRVEFCPTSALASNNYTLLTSGPSPQVPFFQVHTAITYVITNHTRTLYFLHIWYSNVVTTFETSLYQRQYHLQIHSTASPQQKHISILLRLLKTFSCFSTQYGTQTDTKHR